MVREPAGHRYGNVESLVPGMPSLVPSLEPTPYAGSRQSIDSGITTWKMELTQEDSKSYREPNPSCRIRLQRSEIAALFCNSALALLIIVSTEIRFEGVGGMPASKPPAHWLATMLRRSFHRDHLAALTSLQQQEINAK